MEAATPSVQPVDHDERAATADAALDGPRVGATDTRDDVLVERILAGDEHAFELLMRRHNQTLFRAARAIVHGTADAEDVVQETYMKAFRALGRFEGRSSLATWLVRIAINEARTRVRRDARNVPLESVSTAEGELPDDVLVHAAGRQDMAVRSPEDAAGNRELGNVLALAVDRLPETLRSVFVLRCVEGMTVAETAECLDLTEEAVRVRLHRARAALREDIDRRLSAEARRLYCFGQERCDRVVALVLERLRRERA